ncbi:MAG: type II secretion system F family protein, partial [Rubripirellula sp.]|nr:type II secretion system F family protein [Rubripirellula sp.]
MPVFAYTAREMSGKLVSGTLEAASEREVAGMLADRSLFPVTVKEQANASQSVFGGQKKVKGQTMAVFYSQLAALLRAGVPMIRSLNVLSEQSSDAALKDVVGQKRVRVE